MVLARSKAMLCLLASLSTTWIWQKAGWKFLHKSSRLTTMMLLGSDWKRKFGSRSKKSKKVSFL
jgi:hypothetical protein